MCPAVYSAGRFKLKTIHIRSNNRLKKYEWWGANSVRLLTPRVVTDRFSRIGRTRFGISFRGEPRVHAPSFSPPCRRRPPSARS